MTPEQPSTSPPPLEGWGTIDTSTTKEGNDRIDHALRVETENAQKAFEESAAMLGPEKRATDLNQEIIDQHRANRTKYIEALKDELRELKNRAMPQSREFAEAIEKRKAELSKALKPLTLRRGISLEASSIRRYAKTIAENPEGVGMREEVYMTMLVDHLNRAYLEYVEGVGQEQHIPSFASRFVEYVNASLAKAPFSLTVDMQKTVPFALVPKSRPSVPEHKEEKTEPPEKP